VERRRGRIGIEIAADKSHFHAALQLPDRILRRHARRLRQLTDADEVPRKQRDDARDQIVADLRPFQAYALVADMMAHARGAWRENRQISAALALQFELILFDAFADLVIRPLQ